MKLVRASNLEDVLDALFRLPLVEFTGAHNTPAERLKKSARSDQKAEAVLVKALAKPPLGVGREPTRLESSPRMLASRTVVEPVSPP